MLAMLIVAFIVILCILNDYNHGIAYAGLTIVSGLGGYILGRRQAIK